MSTRAQHRAKTRPAPSLNPTAAQAKFDQALASHQRGALTEAAALYSEILASYPKHPDCLHLLGVISYQQKNLNRAIELIGNAIKISPLDPFYHSNYGLALKDSKKLDAALASFDRAIELKPDYAEAHLNRGNTLHDLGQFTAALASYDRAIDLCPNNPDAFNNRGISLRELGQREAAVASHDQAIFLRPDYAEAYSNRGISLQELGRSAEALASFERAVELKPDYAEAHYNRGNALKGIGRLDEAIAAYDLAIQLRPEHADSHYNLGNILSASGQWQAAVASYDKAIAISTEHTEAISNKGNALKNMNQIEQAVACFDQAMALRPEEPELVCNQGAAIQATNEIGAAIQFHDRALQLRPDFANAHWNKALALLLGGDFEHGWPLYEWRWKTDHFSSPHRDFPHPLWLGESSLAGKTVLLHAEQGLGDTIQFCRYARLVTEAGGHVVLEVQPELLSLLSGLDGVASLIPAGTPLPDFDLHCPLLSLPLAFRTSIETIPTQSPYLYPNPAKVSSWKERLGCSTRPRVGIAWSGASAHKNDRNRSIPLASLIPYLPDNCQYFSLQKDIRDSDLDAIGKQTSIYRFDNLIDDFSDTAALCSLMDYVVSVDTSVAHLAAALGRPTTILLPFHPDWRWLLHRSDSPWYPSVTLLRQHAIGDWSAPLTALTGKLTELRKIQSEK